VARGIVHAKRKEWELAIEKYNEALRYCPNYRDAYVARGAAYANLNQYHKAMTEFKMALKIDPTDPNATKYLEICHQRVRIIFVLSLLLFFLYLQMFVY
jgi:tetratricopeptide (TPR) repeat protein